VKEGTVIRIRFHGRGGHGVKTAGRILGTAAFLDRWQAQDSPLYGAERRGAAVASYARIDRGPIRERGPITDPDLIVVADETLLNDPGAGIRVGCRHSCVVFLNSDHRHDPKTFPCPVVTRDLNALALEMLGKRSALSAPLGAVACALVGLPHEHTLEAVRRELGELGLAATVIDRNVKLAERVCELLRPLPFAEQAPEPQIAALLHRATHMPAPLGIPIILASGNSPERHTGSWRLFRPVVDRNACTRCGVCFACCPDSAIALDAADYPVIDTENCKGCLICLEQCPLKAIHEEREVRSW